MFPCRDVFTCWCFGHEWDDSPTIFTSNVLMSENHGQITSPVTTKSLFTASYKFLHGLEQMEMMKTAPTHHFAIIFCGGSVDCGIVTLPKHVLYHFRRLSSKHFQGLGRWCAFSPSSIYYKVNNIYGLPWITMFLVTSDVIRRYFSRVMRSRGKIFYHSPSERSKTR